MVGSPPFLAAIEINEAILEKALLFLASVNAFLCLIEAHLLCPEIIYLPY